MKTNQRLSISIASAAMLLALSGCGGMTTTERDTLIGAGVGGVAGNILGGGSTLGTVGGAAAGGLIGHEVGKRQQR